MNTYIVTCKLPDGEVIERRVKASDHKAAQQRLIDEGMTEIVIVDRETRADHPMSRSVKGVIFAFIIGVIAAGIGIYWFRQAFDRFFK